MSQENVEIVRAVFAAWNAGDMEAIRDRCDPEIAAGADDTEGDLAAIRDEDLLKRALPAARNG